MIDKIKKLGLDVPKEFVYYDEIELALVTGGCGPGKLGDYFVPDTLWGLNITPACVVHDLDYYLGKDKAKADLRFLGNIIKIIRQKSNKFLRPLRLARAMKYYIAVSECGDDFFQSE